MREPHIGTKPFVELAEDRPYLATIVTRILVDRLGGSIKISRGELEAFNGVDTGDILDTSVFEKSDDHYLMLVTKP